MFENISKLLNYNKTISAYFMDLCKKHYRRFHVKKLKM